MHFCTSLLTLELCQSSSHVRLNGNDRLIPPRLLLAPKELCLNGRISSLSPFNSASERTPSFKASEVALNHNGSRFVLSFTLNVFVSMLAG